MVTRATVDMGSPDESDDDADVPSQDPPHGDVQAVIWESAGRISEVVNRQPKYPEQAGTLRFLAQCP